MQLWSPLFEAACVGATICLVAELRKGTNCLSTVKLNKRTEAGPLLVSVCPAERTCCVFNGYIGSPVARIGFDCASSVTLFLLERHACSKGMPVLHACAVKKCKTRQRPQRQDAERLHIMGTCPHYVEASGACSLRLTRHCLPCPWKILQLRLQTNRHHDEMLRVFAGPGPCWAGICCAGRARRSAAAHCLCAAEAQGSKFDARLKRLQKASITKVPLPWLLASW